jgi:cytochrome c5
MVEIGGYFDQNQQSLTKNWRVGRCVSVKMEDRAACLAGRTGACENDGMSEVCSVRWMGRVLLGVVAAGALLGCDSTPPPMPLSELNPQQARGHDVFRAQCAACHYDRSGGSLHGPSLLGLYKKRELPSGAPANDDRVLATVLHGRGMMPAVGNGMDRQDVDDLLAYLHTL